MGDGLFHRENIYVAGQIKRIKGLPEGYVQVSRQGARVHRFRSLLPDHRIEETTWPSVTVGRTEDFKAGSAPCLP